MVAIVGSVTAPGRLRQATAEALSRVPEPRASTHLIDLAEQRIAFADGRPPGEFGDDTAAIIAVLESADAVLLATPVYRGSLTGSLKNLLDHVPVGALREKPTAIVAMGATPHHYLGAERHLRDVLAFFGALTMPTAVYLTSKDFDDRRPSDSAAAALDQLIEGTLAIACAVGGRTSLGPAPFAAARPK